MNRRFLCPEIPPVGEPVQLSLQESYQLRTILRLRREEEVTLLDGLGTVATALASPSGGRRDPVGCTIQGVETCVAPDTRLVLAVAPPRAKQMSRLVRQATELGVGAIHPITTSHSVSQHDADAVEGWRVDAIEAIKQSGNPYLPEIHPAARFVDVVKSTSAPAYVGWVPNQPAASEEPHTAESVRRTGEVWLWIGPEGGFAPEEITALRECGARPLSIGRWTLRVETATIAALSWLTTHHAG